MCLDIGDKRIGVAISDESGKIAQGFTTIQRKNILSDLSNIEKIVTQYNVSEIVVGIPIGMNGKIKKQTKKTYNFINYLQKKFSDIPVKEWDERFSSKASERILIEGNVRRDKRKKIIDQLAATLILQTYLDWREMKE